MKNGACVRQLYRAGLQAPSTTHYLWCGCVLIYISAETENLPVAQVLLFELICIKHILGIYYELSSIRHCICFR